MTHTHDRAGHRPLDSIDRRILTELAGDARLSVRSLAERVHISRTAANARVQQLIATGVITGFGAQVDRKAIGLGVSALVVVRIGERPWEEVAGKLAALPFVERVQAVSGDIDFVLTVSAPDHDQLGQAVLRHIHDMPGVVSTRTHLILDEVEGTSPALAMDDWL